MFTIDILKVFRLSTFLVIILMTEGVRAVTQNIIFRYLKHVVLRFLTARELEARQLTRALSVLLRLTAHEEALLRAALPPRNGLSSWFPSLNNT